MNRKERLELYNEAEKQWGLIAQYDQAIEEMGELIVAINKYKRKCLFGEYKNNPQAAAAASGGMIKFFIQNTTAFLWIVVIPLFALLAANIIGLVLYLKKGLKREKITASDLSDEEKEALKKELLKDLQQEK